MKLYSLSSCLFFVFDSKRVEWLLSSNLSACCCLAKFQKLTILEYNFIIVKQELTQ